MFSSTLLTPTLLRSCLSGLILLSLTACTAEYSRDLTRRSLATLPFTADMEMTRANDWVLSHSSQVLVAYPASSVSPVVNRQLQRSLVSAFQGKILAVSAAPEALTSPRQLLGHARQHQSSFLLTSQVIDFSDLNSSFDKETLSILAQDSLVVRLDLWDVASGRLIDSSLLSASQSPIKSRNQAPLALLAQISDRYAMALIE